MRLINPIQLDDVSPNIKCEQNLLEKSDVLFVIPKFENNSIAGNKEWCDSILSLNKTLGLHGVYHNFNEFGTDRNQEYLREGINIFEQCFGFEPEFFKPPQLEISEGNRELILGNNIILYGKISQLTHKVYHCNDTGEFPNWFIDLF